MFQKAFAAASLHERNAVQRGWLYGLNVIYGVEAPAMAWEHLLRPAAINQRRRMLCCNGGRLKTTLPDILKPFTLAGLLVIARQIA